MYKESSRRTGFLEDAVHSLGDGMQQGRALASRLRATAYSLAFRKRRTALDASQADRVAHWND